MYRTPFSLLEEDSNDFDTSITSQGIVIFSKEKAGRATHNKEKHKHIRVVLTIILSEGCYCLIGLF